MQTLKEGKEFLRKNFDAGAECPCCRQFVKLYKRKLNSNMALGLISIYKLTIQREMFFHISEIFDPRLYGPKTSLRGGGDFAKMLHWELIEELPNKDDPTKRTSGFWRITDRGKQFAREQILVAKYAFIYNQKLWGFSEEQTTIRESLGNHFNYKELMGEML